MYRSHGIVAVDTDSGPILVRVAIVNDTVAVVVEPVADIE
jgi:hypothetical protein